MPTVDVIIEYRGGIVLIERPNPLRGWALPGDSSTTARPPRKRPSVRRAKRRDSSCWSSASSTSTRTPPGTRECTRITTVFTAAGGAFSSGRRRRERACLRPRRSFPAGWRSTIVGSSRTTSRAGGVGRSGTGARPSNVLTRACRARICTSLLLSLAFLRLVPDPVHRLQSYLAEVPVPEPLLDQREAPAELEVRLPERRLRVDRQRARDVDDGEEQVPEFLLVLLRRACRLSPGAARPVPRRPSRGRRRGRPSRSRPPPPSPAAAGPSRRVGKSRGSPSRIESLPAWLFSLSFVVSQWLRTASGVAATRSPKTCGCLRLSFASIPSITSARSNLPSSSVILAMNTIRNRRSPSSSRSCSSSSASSASSTSWNSSTRWGRMVETVCARSHAHPSGERRVAVSSTSASRARAGLPGIRCGPFGGHVARLDRAHGSQYRRHMCYIMRPETLGPCVTGALRY